MASSAGKQAQQQLERIQRVLASKPVDVSRLRKLSLQPGGFVNNETRRKVWPLLLGISPTVLEAARRSPELRAPAFAAKDQVGSGMLQCQACSQRSQSTSSPGERGDTCNCVHLRDPYYEQIDKDVWRSVCHFQVDQPQTLEGGRANPAGGLSATQRAARRESLAALLHTLFLVHQGQLHYSQGFHDVATVVSHVFGWGQAAPSGTSQVESDGLLVDMAHGTFRPETYMVLERLAYLHLREGLRPSLTQVMNVLRLLGPLLRETDGLLSILFRRAQLPPWFCLSWVLTWMSHDLMRLDDCLRVWDVLLSKPPIYILYVIVAQLCSMRAVLLQVECSMPELHRFLGKFLKHARFAPRTSQERSTFLPTGPYLPQDAPEQALRSDVVQQWVYKTYGCDNRFGYAPPAYHFFYRPGRALRDASATLNARNGYQNPLIHTQATTPYRYDYASLHSLSNDGSLEKGVHYFPCLDDILAFAAVLEITVPIPRLLLSLAGPHSQDPLFEAYVRMIRKAERGCLDFVKDYKIAQQKAIADGDAAPGTRSESKAGQSSHSPFPEGTFPKSKPAAFMKPAKCDPMAVSADQCAVPYGSPVLVHHAAYLGYYYKRYVLPISKKILPVYRIHMTPVTRALSKEGSGATDLAAGINDTYFGEGSESAGTNQASSDAQTQPSERKHLTPSVTGCVLSSFLFHNNLVSYGEGKKQKRTSWYFDTRRASSLVIGSVFPPQEYPKLPGSERSSHGSSPGGGWSRPSEVTGFVYRPPRRDLPASNDGKGSGFSLMGWLTGSKQTSTGGDGASAESKRDTQPAADPQSFESSSDSDQGPSLSMRTPPASNAKPESKSTGLLALKPHGKRLVYVVVGMVIAAISLFAFRRRKTAKVA